MRVDQLRGRRQRASLAARRHLQPLQRVRGDVVAGGARTSPHVMSPSPLASSPSALSRSRSAMSHWPCSACAIALDRQVGVAGLVRDRGRCEQRERREQHDRAHLHRCAPQRGDDRRILEPIDRDPVGRDLQRVGIACRARRFDQDAQVGRLALHRPVVARERRAPRPRRFRSSGESALPRAGAGCRRAVARRRSARRARRDARRTPRARRAAAARRAPAAAASRRCAMSSRSSGSTSRGRSRSSRKSAYAPLR